MKKTIAIITVILTLAVSVTALASDKVTYTFKGNNVITDGSPNDITDAPLTDNITVTTSGDMNRKYVGITDLKHNSEVGTFPANSAFKAAGSYLYLACANANDNAVITLNMPTIAKGSKVTVTFAKPVVTNNGSTLRNTNDPYAYLKIADRYISVNGDNFDTWRTESVVTGEDTGEIEFHCDKWGAVAISKIEITGGDKTALHALSISSTQYANLAVNGIKFCADETGNITIPSYPEGEKITVTAYKEGYKTAEKSLNIGKSDTSVSIPLECESDAVYYESDFGNTAGTLTLDGEYKFGDGIEAEEVTRVFARATFEENGYLDINTDGNVPVHIGYDGKFITLKNEEFVQKNNMEFEVFYDKKNNQVFLIQGERYCYLNDDCYNPDREAITLNTVNSISGKGVSLEYIGISYPDTKKLTIVGPDKAASPIQEDSYYSCVYEAIPEYYLPGESVTFSGEADCAKIETQTRGRSLSPTFITKGNLIPTPNTSGKITITAEYNGAVAEKEVEIIQNAKIAEFVNENKGNTVYCNLHSTGNAILYAAKDEYGTELQLYAHYVMKDFKSSDESVIRIDDEGNFTAVGKGRATITANAYTGIDNIFEFDYVVDEFYKEGIAEAQTTYVANDFDNEYITGYKVSWYNGTETAVPTQIPAATVREDGTVVTVYFDLEKTLRRVESVKVRKGDKVLPTNEARKVYFCKEGSIEPITKDDTSIEGFAITGIPKGTTFELSPIYTYTDLGDVAEGVTLDGVFPNGRYDFTFKKGEAKRGDIYVNGYMAGNNVDQSDTDRRLSEGSSYTVKVFYINDDKITVSMTDGSTLLDSVTVSRTDWENKPTVYIIGDSLVCNYYGDFEKEVGGGRTGWGQVIGNYLNANIVNLANSGQYAKGLYDTAFPSVVNNRPNYCLIECGYNDRSYSTRDEMEECVTAMINECREAGVTPILVTPNASGHDYKPSVSWSSYLRDTAVDTGCLLIDLSQESYDFLYSLYGDNTDGVVAKNYNLTEVGGDNLHSSYAAAYKWASMVAQDMKDMEIQWNSDDLFNKDFAYTFTDTLGNEIICEIK